MFQWGGKAFFAILECLEMVSLEMLASITVLQWLDDVKKLFPVVAIRSALQKSLLSFAGWLKVKPLVVWKRNPSKPKGLRV